ncbi:EAL domain-containing protein (putative c-di-GMP-specific phosphodiesterase class I) [Pantoea sp. PNA 14-12]|uniref:sensor domain-containing diguanylate cyclase n=1 Tax=Pantoea TaxID=53335 RepID=UPI000736EA43|nr:MULTISPECIES: EAL domain-containing protein [Pantoea]KTS27991.1 histidine kinase [Pantoea stewartii]MBC0853509.1 EAL domain-containing protein [Pantoea stewartii]MCU7365290.1 EAL domain-containing protein [Pantoea stewartii]NRH22544.1 histidine kinase [Pantoea stewartii]TDS72333.1 EAL domain-containing protein (putative c-di-GMP-specific phosphodiesterase class I) [Pantoea sp. PNA 14-12]
MLINIRHGAQSSPRSADILRLPDQERDEVLNHFAALTSTLLGIPTSFISVLDEQHQTFRAKYNTTLCQTDRKDAFCRFVVESAIPVIVPDTLLDARFATNPLVTGEPYLRFYAGVPLINAQGKVMGTLCVTDSQPHAFPAEKVRLLSRLAAMVTVFLKAWQVAGLTDAVTGLPNRQQLIRHLDQLSEAGHSDVLRLTVIDCIDMPRAYELARALGMPPVEALLRDSGRLLQNKLALGPEKIFYTVATGRFAFLSRSDEPFSADAVLEAMRDVRPLAPEGLAMDLTLYAGDVCFTPAALPAQEALRRAVSALHEAISINGGARSFSEVSDSRRNGDFMLMNDLSAALKTGTGGLYLVYQPRLSLSDVQPTGFEALIRWCHPERGELSPAEFLPAAQLTSLMSDITDWVITEVIHQLRVWLSEGISLPVSVNVSVSDLARSGFIDHLDAKMAQAQLPPALLEFECLETELATENPAALAMMAQLRQRGYRLSLDDFGAGYSNIGYLRRMPVDVIKLDRALIADLTSNEASRIIASSVIGMLKSLNYVVVAEGVEIPEALDMLASWGCDQAQGFYISHPLLPQALKSWLSTFKYGQLGHAT